MLRGWKFKRFFAVLSCILLFAGIFLNSGMGTEAAQERRTVRIAFPESDSDGLYVVYEDGSLGGMMYEYYENLNRFAGWDIEYVTGTMDALYEALFAGEIDIMGSTTYLDAMTEYVDYSDLPGGYASTVLFANKNDTSMVPGDYSTYNGKSVAVYKKAVGKIQQLDEFCIHNGIELEYKFYDDSIAYMSALANGEADLMLSGEAIIQDGFVIMASFEQQPFYNVVTKGKTEILRELNQAMFNMQQLEPEFVQNLYNSYFSEPYKFSVYFSSKEKAFIQEEESLTVVLSPDTSLLAEYDAEHDVWSGFQIDVIKEIEQESGLHFSYVYADTYREACEMVQSGKADMMLWQTDLKVLKEYSVILDSPEAIKLTSAYMTLPIVNLKLSERSSNTGKIIHIDNDREDQEIEGDILFCHSLASALDTLKAGKADSIELNNYVAECIVRQNPFVYVTEMQAIDYKAVFYIGVSTGSRPELLSILEKTVHSVDSSRINYLMSANLTAVEENITFKSFVRKYTPLVIGSVVFVILLIFGTLCILYIGKVKQSAYNASLREKKEHEEALKRALKISEEANQSKSEFLSRMSHDIRTPMNAIIGMTEIADMNAESPEQVKACLGKIRYASGHLMNLINDILDMAKIERNKIKLNETKIYMPSLIEALKTMVLPQIEEKNHCFEYECTGLIHPWVIGDEMRIKQILLNILSNAVKFTNSGGHIRLQLEELPSDSEHKALYVFTCTDNGRGMSEAFLKDIFQPFAREDENRTTKAEGSGLGMAIAKSLTEMMHGSIEVDSKIHEGTKMCIRLELTVTQGAASKAEEENNVSEQTLADCTGKRILIVEDNDLNREIAVEIIKTSNAQIETVQNGKEAVDKFEASAEGYYDLIFMDIRMPVMDGYEAARNIRALDRADAKTVVIIALTANAFEEDVRAAKESGMQAHMSKPIEIKRLNDILRRWLIS